jgi:hypothetical protein
MQQAPSCIFENTSPLDAMSTRNPSRGQLQIHRSDTKLMAARPKTK